MSVCLDVEWKSSCSAVVYVEILKYDDMIDYLISYRTVIWRHSIYPNILCKIILGSGNAKNVSHII